MEKSTHAKVFNADAKLSLYSNFAKIYGPKNAGSMLDIWCDVESQKYDDALNRICALTDTKAKRDAFGWCCSKQIDTGNLSSALQGILKTTDAMQDELAKRILLLVNKMELETTIGKISDEDQKNSIYALFNRVSKERSTHPKAHLDQATSSDDESLPPPKVENDF